VHIPTPPDVSLPFLGSFGSCYLDNANDEELELQHATLSIFDEYLWGGWIDGSSSAEADTPRMSMIPGVALMTTLETKQHYQTNKLLRRNCKFDILSAHRRHLPPSSGSGGSFFNISIILEEEDYLEPGTELLLPPLLGDDANDDDDNNQADNDNHTLDHRQYQMFENFVYQMHDYFSKLNMDDDEKEEIYEFLTTSYLEAAWGEERTDYANSFLLPADYESFEQEIMPMISQYQEQDKQLLNSKESSTTNDPASSSQSLLPLIPKPLLFFGQPPSLSWLEQNQNSQCVDSDWTIYPGVSTLPNSVGQGAFASKKFRADDRILIVPLLPIPDAEILDYYTDNDDYDDSSNNPGNRRQQNDNNKNDNNKNKSCTITVTATRNPKCCFFQ
jgi:hypothetical protein